MLNCYIDQSGGRRSGLPPKLYNLGSFLENDVQGSIIGCDLALQDAEDVEQGKCEAFHSTGNAFDVLIEAGYVTIDSLWDDALPSLKLNLSEYREALLEWRGFIIETSTNG